MPRKTKALADVLVFIHGGNWNSGSKGQYRFLGAQFARRGIVTVIIDYPLSPGADYKQMATAAAKALVWTKQNIAQYKGNPDKIFVSGHSAGGHLAALLAVKPEYFNQLGVPNPIKGVILIDAAGLDYEMWTGPAPMRAYDGLPHIRWWRTFMEYGNGIMGDMCIHMFDTARWMLQLGWPNRINSTGGILVQKEGKSNIADTQTATFEYDNLNCVWQHRSWGTPANPDYPWALTIYGDKGTLIASTMRYDFIPQGPGEKIRKDVVYEKEKYPEDLTEERIELNAAPATRLHMLDFLSAIEKGTKPVADIEEGHISTASCILANISMKVGRPLVYDPKKRVVVNDPEATALLQRQYRQPWVHPLPETV